MNTSLLTKKVSGFAAAAMLLGTLVGGCAGGGITTREAGAGIGALGGATAGGLIGTAVHHPAIGAAVGTALGLGAGALIGDQLQGRQNQGQIQDQQIYQNQQELARQRAELDRLRNQRNEY